MAIGRCSGWATQRTNAAPDSPSDGQKHWIFQRIVGFLPESFNPLPTPQAQRFTNQVLIEPGFPLGLAPTVIIAQLWP